MKILTRQTSVIPSTRFNAWKELGRQTTQTTDTSQTIQTTQTTYMNIMTKDNHIKKMGFNFGAVFATRSWTQRGETYSQVSPRSVRFCGQNAEPVFHWKKH